MNNECENKIRKALKLIGEVMDEMNIGLEFRSVSSIYHRLNGMVSQ